MEFTNTPPTAKGGGRPGRNDWPAIAAELRDNPGQWAVVFTSSTSGTVSGCANGIKVGRAAHFRPQGAFSAVTRVRTTDEGDKVWDLWAAYLGDE